MTFGSGGIVTTDLGSAHDLGTDIALQPDGAILLAGWTVIDPDPPTLRDFVVARYDPDGALDATFGSGGLVTTDFDSGNDLAETLAIQADGAIVVAGRSDDDFALARYLPDGTLDASFGSGGKVVTDVEADDWATSVAIHGNGKIVVAGRTLADFALVHYNPDATLDTSFGSGGVVRTAFDGASVAFDVALQPDDKIVLAGYAAGATTGWDFALARYLVETCPWDLDGGGGGHSDLQALIAAWGKDPGGPPDFNGDGIVSTVDLLQLLANWGACP